MTWNELYMILHQKMLENKDLGEETATVYCAGSGEYFAVDDVCRSGEGDVVDPDSLVMVIQN
jgi:hypothetical protein